MEKTVSAVLVAAGSSTRMGFDKLSFDLGGETVLHRSIRAFAQCPQVTEIVLVAGKNREFVAQQAADCPKPVQIVAGGATRAESAKNGVLAAHGELVAVHDAARPFVSEQVITDALAEAEAMGAAAPAVAEEAVAILQQRGVLGAEKADYKDGRRHIRFKELSAEEKAALVKEQPAYGRVICRCETITEGEILDALHTEIPATTIDGVKRRAGAGMGRCQGGFCGPRVLELISRELGIDPLDILQDKNGSNVLLSETKVGGKNNG